jgi:uncharacterized delta-60 repeat protein
MRRGLRVILAASLLAGASLLAPIGHAPARASGYQLDPSFGGAGYVKADYDNADWHERQVELMVRADGSVQFAGTSRFEGDWVPLPHLVGLSAAGTPDPALGPDGVHKLDGDFVEGGADGSFVTLRSTDSGKVLKRYLRPGVVDTEFGTAGSLPVSFAATNRTPILRARNGGGGWYAVGTALGTDRDWVVTKLTATGAPDERFGPGGTVRDDFGGDDDPRAAVVQADGKLLVAGGTGATGDDAMVARYADGGLDPTFSGDGRATSAFGRGAAGESIVLQPDGKVVVVGIVAHRTEARGNIALMRFLPDGNLDPSFGTGGLVETDLGGSGWAVGYEVAVARNGDLLVVGSRDIYSADGAVLLRYRPDGTLDSSFGTGGVITVRFGQSGAWLTSVAVDGDHVYVAGTTAGSTYWVVARYGPTPKPPAPTTTTTTTTTRDTSVPTPTTTTTTTAPDLGKAGPKDPGPVARRSGYWMVGADGTVYRFGDAGWYGHAAVGKAEAVDIEPSPSGDGYWVVDSAGKVHAFGDAASFGNVDSSWLRAGERITSLSARPQGLGYLVFTSKGRVVAIGPDGRNELPGLGHLTLNGPVLDSVATPSGNGYFMVASDGGIFTFGDAVFHGSMGDRKLNAPVQSLVPDGDGEGYWLVASDGGIFAFRADFRGSMGATRLNRPVTGMVRAGAGYLMVGEDGGVFDFSGDANSFKGSLGANPPVRPITSVALLEAHR